MPYPSILAGQTLTAATLNAMMPITVVKAADEGVTSSTTLQNDNDFAFTLEANSTYQFWGAIFYNGEFNAGHLKATWTLPVGATIQWSLNSPVMGASPLYDSGVATSGNLTAGTYGTTGRTTASIKGTVATGGGSGTMQFQWAQNASNAAATTIFAKSWINLRRVI